MDRCLYCLGLDGPPSVEHLAPAALGEVASRKLPSGAVCEPCNNWTGRVVDEAFVQLSSVRFVRAIHRIPDERGRRVERLDLKGETRVEFPPSGPFIIKMVSREAEARGDFVVHDMFQRAAREGEGEKPVDFGPATHALVYLPPGTDTTAGFTIDLDFARKRSDSQDRRAARALMKMGLCLVYAERGADAALWPRYDITRAGILGQPYEGFILTAPTQLHDARLDLTVEISTEVPGVEEVARIRYGHFEMLTGMQPSPLNDETRAWAEARGWEVTPIAAVPDSARPSQALSRLGVNWKALCDAGGV